MLVKIYYIVCKFNLEPNVSYILLSGMTVESKFLFSFIFIAVIHGYQYQYT